MREISEYIFVGNYLLLFLEKHGQDSIKYETIKLLNDRVLEKVNKNSINYQLLKMDDKMNMVKKMISKGVFRTEPGNKMAPFKQVYNYEIAKGIFAFYTCDGNLTFKLQKTSEQNKDFIVNNIKSTYQSNLNLDLKNAITSVVTDFKLKQKNNKIK